MKLVKQLIIFLTIFNTWQREETKRKENDDKKDVAIKKINESAKIIHKLIREGVEERKMISKECFKMMKKIIDKKKVSGNDVKIFEMLNDRIKQLIENPTISLPEFQKNINGLITQRKN